MKFSMICLKVPIMLLLVVVVVRTGKSQTILELRPEGELGKDAFVHGLITERAKNFGVGDELPASSWTYNGIPGDIRSLLDFDLSELEEERIVITGAYLSLYAIDHDNGQGFHDFNQEGNAGLVRRVLTDWDEHLVNWNNQPGTTPQNEVYLNASSDMHQDYLDIDVTGLVQDMLLYPDSSFGFLMMQEIEFPLRRLNFASSDHSNPELHPRLVIQYFVLEENTICTTLKPGIEEGKDTYVHGLFSETDKNFGDIRELPVSAWTYNTVPASIRTLIEFDVSAYSNENIDVKQAFLTLHAIDTDQGQGFHKAESGPNTAWIERVVEPWDEFEVTWNTQPATTSLNRVEIWESYSPYSDYFNIDVTDLILDIVDDPNNSYGFMLKLQTEQARRRLTFASSDNQHAELHPSLNICYQMSTGLKDDENGVQSYGITPNPNNGIFSISSDISLRPESSYYITNGNGKIMQRGIIRNLNTVFDLSNFNEGIYFFTILVDEIEITQKFVIFY